MAAVINDSRYYIANYKRRLLFLFKHYTMHARMEEVHLYSSIYTHIHPLLSNLCTVHVAIPHHLVCKDFDIFHT